MFKQYGDTWTCVLVGKPRFVWTVDERNVQYMLKDNFENFIKGRFFFECFEEGKDEYV